MAHHRRTIGAATLLNTAISVGEGCIAFYSESLSVLVAFRISMAIGTVVAAAVIAHDLVDGFNTVSLMITHANSRRRSLVMLVLDALAPPCGTLAALSLPIPERLLTLYLGFFCRLPAAHLHDPPFTGGRGSAEELQPGRTRADLCRGGLRMSGASGAFVEMLGRVEW